MVASNLAGDDVGDVAAAAPWSGDLVDESEGFFGQRDVRSDEAHVVTLRVCRSCTQVITPLVAGAVGDSSRSTSATIGVDA
jgi:hypothetical protein